MKVAITDANIFIDLHDLGCLSWFELLGLEVYTTSLVLNELGVVQRMSVQKIVGVVAELTIDEVDDLALLQLPVLIQLMRINQWLPSKACIERLEKWGESD